MDTSELTQKLSGVFAPLCTPFTDDEEVDYASLAANMARYADTGLLGYLALGSNGENRSLSEEEKLQVLSSIVRSKGPRQVVLAGATYDAQRHTERFLSQAADCGADFGLVLPPGYYRKQMTDDVLHRYYCTVADASPLPLLLYNAPHFSGVALSADLVGRLAVHPKIVGMKDSAASGIEQFLHHESPSFHVLAGSANFLFPAMMGGSVGGTVSLANYCPDLAVQLYKYGRDRNGQAGSLLQQRVTRINNAVGGAFGVPGVKAAMNLAGLHVGPPRRPLLALDEARVAQLKDMLLAEGIL
jgi:4-hydroxy-2-oxoglutarate aldolase